MKRLGAVATLLVALLFLGRVAQAQEPAPGRFPPAAGDSAKALTDSLAARGADSLGAGADSLRARADTTKVDKVTNIFAPTPRDSLGAPFHYTTSYSVNRNLATWTQNLFVDTWFKSVHIDNATAVNFREDTERHTRSGTRTSNLHVNYLSPQNITVGMALELERDTDGPVINGRLRPTSSIKNTSARMTAGDSIYLWQQPLVLALEGGTVSHDENSAERRSTGGSDLVQRADWTFLAYRPIQFHMTEDYTHSGTSGAILQGGTDTTFHNDDMNLGGQSRFLVPWKDIQMNLNGTYSHSAHEQPTSGKFENVQSTTRSLDASFTMIPGNWLTLNITGRTNKNEVISDVEATRNYKNYGTGGSMSLVYRLPLLGQFTTSLTEQISDNLRRNTVGGVPDSQNTDQQSLTTTFKRDLGPDFDAQLNVASDLRSTRYGNFKQNQDYLNRRLGGTLNFHKDGWPISMVLQASQVLNHTVFLDASRSGRNNTDVLYSIEYDINYVRNSGLAVTQSYIVSANSTVSDFEGNPFVTPDNRFIKSTNYLTTIRDNIFPRASVELNHNLRLTRTGSYDLDPASGQRLFGESSNGQSNDLTLRFNYRFTDWLTGVIQDRTQFLHQDNLDFSGNKVPNSRQRIIDFNAGMNVVYAFGEHSKLQGTFSRSARLDTLTPYVNGTLTKPRENNQDYFLVQASLDVVFF